MSTSFWLDKSSGVKSKSSDVVIVGGGITGLSLAFWMQKKDPELSITILEKGRLGSGATGRNAGFVTCGSVEHFNRMVSKHGEVQALEIWRFAEENLRLLKEHVIGDDAASLEFHQRGAYSLAAKDAELAELNTVAQLMSKHKIPVETLDAQQIEERVGARGFVGGIRYCNDGEIHPIKLAERLRSQLKATVSENTTVSYIEATKEGTRRVQTDQGVFEAQIVVLAANGYAASLHPYFKEKIYPTRGQMLMFEPVAPFMDAPCYANFYLDYFRQMPGGELLIGGFRQIEKATEVGYSDHITEAVQAALEDFVTTHLPQFQGRRVTHRWAGVMGFSTDGEPMVGSLPDDNQIYFAGGYTGHGLGMAFHVAKNCVDLIFGDKVPDWLSSRRF